MDPFFKNLLANLHTIILVWLAIVVFVSFLQIKILKKGTGMSLVHAMLIASLISL